MALEEEKKRTEKTEWATALSLEQDRQTGRRRTRKEPYLNDQIQCPAGIERRKDPLLGARKNPVRRI